ncbi:MAG: cysteine desulfurase [Verrucomicrobia bacterium]|nr:MAG: cysteine desulfurase [Verrucomicrobiota bacterium]
MTWSGYFDANATTPLWPVVRERYLEALDTTWQNASSLYHAAGAARRELEGAREELADALGIGQPERIVFGSGATESANLVFRHLAAKSAPDAKVMISPLEHPCVRDAAFDCFPGRVIPAPLDGSGAVDLEATAARLERDRPVLLSVMAANNETGALQPWRELGEIARGLEIPYHCDAAQWLGKMPLDEFGSVDWLTGSGHKFGAPKGTGFLVVPEGIDRLRGASVGGAQESGRRAGTENVPGILAMMTGLTEAGNLLSQVSGEARDEFEERILRSIPGTRVVGEDGPRLWNTSMLVLPAFSNLSWLTRLSHLGFQVSTGSACSAGKGHPSHVMEAMGLSPDEMGRVLRASALWSAGPDEWSGLAAALEGVWTELCQPSGEAREKRRLRL